MNEVEEKLQNTVDEANSWYLANRLAINTSKSNTMLIGTGPRLCNTDRTLDITIDGTHLELAASARYLGKNIDNTLNWGNQVQAVCKNLSFQIFKDFPYTYAEGATVADI